MFTLCYNNDSKLTLVQKTIVVCGKAYSQLGLAVCQEGIVLKRQCLLCVTKINCCLALDQILSVLLWLGISYRIVSVKMY